MLSQRAYAKRKGVSPQYINKLVLQGKIPTINGQIDPGKADAALENNRDPAHQGHRKEVPRAAEPRVSIPREQSRGSLNFLEARTIREQIKAKLDKLEYDRRTGKLVESEKVKEVAENAFKNVRDRLLILPRTLSAVLAGTSKASEAEQILTDAIFNALEGLSTDVFVGGEIDAESRK
ncbi:MAG: hypothetical protein ACJ71Q_07830 [Terriglobales bacterium]